MRKEKQEMREKEQRENYCQYLSCCYAMEIKLKKEGAIERKRYYDTKKEANSFVFCFLWLALFSEAFRLRRWEKKKKKAKEKKEEENGEREEKKREKKEVGVEEQAKMEWCIAGEDVKKEEKRKMMKILEEKKKQKKEKEKNKKKKNKKSKKQLSQPERQADEEAISSSALYLSHFLFFVLFVCFFVNCLVFHSNLRLN